MLKATRALLFANGPNASLPPDWKQEGDLLVAVDGGLRHLLALHEIPDLLIGDLDSITPEELAFCENAEVEIIHFPPAKDETDLELAVRDALRRGLLHIVIYAAIGGSPDHFLGNLALLSKPELGRADISLRDATSTFSYTQSEACFPAEKGDLVSLIPWGLPAEGVFTENLLYPLHGENLIPWQTRGLRNRATASPVTIRLQSGGLFIYHQTHNGENYEKTNIL